MHCWENTLDLAGINSWVVYKECTNSKISRRKFILQLVQELSKNYRLQRGKTLPGDEGQPDDDANGCAEEAGKRRKCQVLRVCRGNKSSSVCASCKKVVCGKCSVIEKFCHACHEKKKL